MEAITSYTQKDFDATMEALGITIGASDLRLIGVGDWPMPQYPSIPSVPITPFSGHCPCCSPRVTVGTSTALTSVIVPQRYINPIFAGKRKRRAS